MPYRDNDHVLEAAKAEARELAALGRDARMRRVQAGAVLGASLFFLLAGTALAAGSSAARTPRVHCHRVTVVYEDSEGPPHPAASWQSCEVR